ncbi:hypothetical protein R3W88_034122 [Solanum pinnatisectum]|uniref:Uncharacterized protein n=1 Tax=Solanum pinnatisectum TaxID=50273 RepID=A0AAV9K143_9SOLN|nr:hypothetical protein R3W88_034122 [Solanum pinnatisectum]
MKEEKMTLEMIRRSEVAVELQDLTTSIEREDKRQWKRLSHSPLLVVNIVIILSRLFARVNRVVVTKFTCTTYTFFDRRKILISTYVGMFLAQVLYNSFFS